MPTLVAVGGGWQLKIVATTTGVTVTVQSAGSGFTSGDTITIEADTVLEVPQILPI